MWPQTHAYCATTSQSEAPGVPEYFTCSLSCAGSSSSAAGGKKAEQLSDEELKAALPSMLFTTSNLIWSSKCSQCRPEYQSGFSLSGSLNASSCFGPVKRTPQHRSSLKSSSCLAHVTHMRKLPKCTPMSSPSTPRGCMLAAYTCFEGCTGREALTSTVHATATQALPPSSTHMFPPYFCRHLHPLQQLWPWGWQQQACCVCSK